MLLVRDPVGKDQYRPSYPFYFGIVRFLQPQERLPIHALFVEHHQLQDDGENHSP